MKKTVINGIAVCLFISLAAFNGDARGSSTEEAGAASNTAAPSAGGTLSGTVLETMDSGGYTYLQLDTGLSKPWVAIPQSAIKVGEKIDCQPGMVMKNFSSKTLNKTFDTIVFSSGLAGSAGNPHGGGAMPPMGNPHKKGPAQGGDDSFANAVQAEGGGPVAQQPAAGSGGSLSAIAPFSEIKVEKAGGDNGYTVEEIFSQREKLNGKTVAVQGKVVKFSPMIMGVNWIHLQDGTGDPMTNTHDLVITTSEEVTNGDVITVEGVLTANKDFGAGYKYEAIVEKAKTLK